MTPIYAKDVFSANENVIICNKCKIEKILSEKFFYKGNSKSGFVQPCKNCRKEYQENYFNSIPEDVRKEKDRIKYQKRKKKHREVYYVWRENNREEWRKYYREYLKSEKGKTIAIRHNENRRAMRENLPHTLTKIEMQSIKMFSNGRCALTDSQEVHLEHFIPISWGHGGTYLGNVYLLDGSLNQKKRNKNPFEWIKQKSLRSIISNEKWESLISLLAKQNDLTVSEFIDFVYWCEGNKRSARKIKDGGGKTSIQLWREKTQ